MFTLIQFGGGKRNYFKLVSHSLSSHQIVNHDNLLCKLLYVKT